MSDQKIEESSIGCEGSVNKLKPKIGFLFGAGAELSYGMPTGGEFAISIFRHDTTTSKDEFKDQKKAIASEKNYLEWLPKHYKNQIVTAFNRRTYEDIIRCTVEENREDIIDKVKKLDDIARKLIEEMLQEGVDIEADFRTVNGYEVQGSSKYNDISFNSNLKEGNVIFKNDYFSALILAYRKIEKDREDEAKKLGKMILSILQLLVGALAEELVHNINDALFEKKDDDLKILDDWGKILRPDYKSFGMEGLELLCQTRNEVEGKNAEERIQNFAWRLTKQLYSNVLDYKSLIDSNWMYLYRPKTDWGKFSKICIFLYGVQKYMENCYNNLSTEGRGYYDDLAEAVKDERLTISAVGTSNYTPLIRDRLHLGKEVVHLNGAIDRWYDPYLNRSGSKQDLEELHHFIVPLIFTQSGTKPMLSIEQSKRYVDYFYNLKDSDVICVIGFGFNSDDEHINNLFRELIDKAEKKIVIITKSVSNSDGEKDKIIRKLRIQKESECRLSVIYVDGKRNQDGRSWIDCLLDEINEGEVR